MNQKVFWLSIVAVIVSFIGGFLLANALNRNELTTLRAENERLKNTQNEAGSKSNGTLAQRRGNSDKNRRSRPKSQQFRLSKKSGFSAVSLRGDETGCRTAD
jgi:hypothetical protein